MSDWQDRRHRLIEAYNQGEIESLASLEQQLFQLYREAAIELPEQWDAEDRSPQENDQCDQFLEALVEEGFMPTPASAFSELIEMGYDPYDMGELMELVD